MMQRPEHAMDRTHLGDLTIRLAVIGAVFAAGFLINGAVMAIALASGVSVAMFSASMTSRCWPRKPGRE